MCAALRTALEATIYRPDRERQFIVMDDDYIRKGLHDTGSIVLPRARPDRTVHFCHYYHPQQHLLAIRNSLHDTGTIVLPQARPDRTVHFCHYYHPQQHLLADKPKINLVGFPFARQLLFRRCRRQACLQPARAAYAARASL